MYWLGVYNDLNIKYLVSPNFLMDKLAFSKAVKDRYEPVNNADSSFSLSCIANTY